MVFRVIETGVEPAYPAVAGSYPFTHSIVRGLPLPGPWELAVCLARARSRYHMLLQFIGRSTHLPVFGSLAYALM